MGTRFQLAMTPAQIEALPVPAYRKTILRAMARYGMYVADTGGSWAVIQVSALVTMSFGLEDRWAESRPIGRRVVLAPRPSLRDRHPRRRRLARARCA